MGFNAAKYYKAIQDSVDATKEKAFKHLVENAVKIKANAVVGIKVEIEFTSTNYAIVSVTGTAVKVC